MRRRENVVWVEQGQSERMEQARHHPEGKEARVCSEPLWRASGRGERAQGMKDEKATFLE